MVLIHDTIPLQEKPTLQPQPSVSDGLVWTTPKPNFNMDSAALIKKFEEKWMEEEQLHTRPSPDEKLEMAESGWVYGKEVVLIWKVYHSVVAIRS